ncbi:MAG: hypothetical protein JXA94_04005, partial [Parachlamydiales bacterium]|nr:hypothetical protein [Parachlamydiales bacterium]
LKKSFLFNLFFIIDKDFFSSYFKIKKHKKNKYMRYFLLFILLTSFTLEDFNTEDLEKDSMLYQSENLARKYSAEKYQWQHEYGLPQPEKVCEMGSAWLDCYPRSIITKDGQSVIETLSDKKLWDVLTEIGIEGLHTNPMKVAGGIYTGKPTPSVDGGYDRISLKIDPAFGTDEQYIQMANTIHSYKAILIGDLIPGHTGLGSDFILALKKYKDYPGIYNMVEIDQQDWNILPKVKSNELSVNLNFNVVDKLKEKGYIVGRLQRVIFAEPGIKVSNWDVTREITGVDGKKRRWVYLHYFKAGQPSLNWLDPTFAANRLISGDIMKSIGVLKDNILRLDANGFLGVEIKTGSEKAWSEGHPLSIVATNLISMLIRKLGGFSFQELNLTVPDLKSMLKLGADLSYDFITRTAYCHALLASDADFLRMNYCLLNEANISPIRFIHALQNHDEITYELVNITDDECVLGYKNKKYSGKELRDIIIKQDYKVVKKPYVSMSGNGLCTTMIGLCAAAMGINDIYNMTDTEKQKVKKAHLLLTFFNAMQPGVFMLSGWDIVGALPLESKQIPDLLKDKDCRWLNRGAYDLINIAPDKTVSFSNIPKAKMLYGPLNEQLKDPNSYVSNLKKILKVRKDNQIDLSQLKKVLKVKNSQLFLALYKLPKDESTLLVALNFGKEKIAEKINIDEIKNSYAVNLIEEKNEEKKFSSNEFNLSLEALQAKAIVFKKEKFKKD